MMKKSNRHREEILNFIYKNQPISRIRIGEITGIRLATITEVVRDFIRMGLVKETGKLKNRQGVGRKENLLEIIPEGKYFIGCALNSSEVRVLILNLKGEILHQRSEVLSFEGKDTSGVLSEIADTVKSLIKESNVPEKKVYGMGFVDPGVVDKDRGISIFSSIMPKWKNVPVKNILEKKLGFRVFLINTSLAKVLAEHLFGKGRGIDDLVFIEYGRGISCGIISGGKPIGGYMEMAGEMGHFNIPGRDEQCRCGRKGCLEALVSIPAIEKRTMDFLKRGQVSSLDVQRGPNRRYLTTISDIVKAFECGDPLAVKVMKESSVFLSSAVGNVVKLLNPKVVILESNFKILGKEFLKVFLKDIRKNMLYGEDVRFDISDMGEEQAGLGGAALTLQNFLRLDR